MSTPRDDQNRPLIRGRATSNKGYSTWNLSLPAYMARAITPALRSRYFTVEFVEEGILYRPGPTFADFEGPTRSEVAEPPSWMGDET